MTLCIGWKNGNNINFASDSRFSNYEDNFVDIGIKVMAVNVKINNPIPSETGIETTIYDHKLGICFCGDTFNAFLFKETIEEVLQDLQFLPRNAELSLEGICGLIATFLNNTSNMLKKGFNMDLDNTEFLIGGYCPLSQKVLVYKFELVDYTDRYEVIFDEILEDDNDLIILGSGKEKAEEIIEDNDINPGIKLLKVLRDVCEDNSVPSVGGYIQYGRFENNNFKIFGIQDYLIDDHGLLDIIYAFRGTVFYKDKFDASITNFHIATRFITPFKDEINDYLDNH